jgi:CheY-like chemotaxis protein
VPRVMANQARLVQVVLNLLINAWQALPDPDPERHRIEVRTLAELPWAVIEVADTGPGVPPADRPRIFEPFFTTKEIGTGTGLGLFVCRNLVASVGGDIALADRPGGGALFRVRLRATDQVPETAAAAPGESEPKPADHRPRVLIIDDDPSVARSLALVLDSEVDAIPVVDPREGLEILVNDAQIDLAYCDLMMRGLNGMDFYEQLQARAPEQVRKLVFMTGGTFTARSSSFVAQQRERVVFKPFDVIAETRRRLKQLR